uniref:Uncharacterized protein n=1 Tax=viral metagenome TaxID=1070528 RepID=A0A6C0HVW3_9ZZZZ
MDINKYQNLGQTKYMWIFYYLMCPKTREAHLNEYKSNNIPIPDYLDENKLMMLSDSIDKDELSKLTKNINKKYINQKYLLFLNKINIEHFNNNSSNNNYYIYIFLILILILILIFIYNILNKSS